MNIEQQYLEYRDDISDYAWQPACGGTEKPFEWQGHSYLYMYNTMTGEHMYYDQTNDEFVPAWEFE